MNVYLVPISADRFECYYEAPEDEDDAEPVQGDGDIVTRLPVEITVAPQRLAVVRPRR